VIAIYILGAIVTFGAILTHLWDEPDRVAVIFPAIILAIFWPWYIAHLIVMKLLDGC
jgi:hypothetical protein